MKGVAIILLIALYIHLVKCDDDINDIIPIENQQNLISSPTTNVHNNYLMNALRFSQKNSKQTKVKKTKAGQKKLLKALQRKTKVRLNRLELAIGLGANHLTGTRHTLKQILVRWISIGMVQANARDKKNNLKKKIRRKTKKKSKNNKNRKPKKTKHSNKNNKKRKRTRRGQKKNKSKGKKSKSKQIKKFFTGTHPKALKMKITDPILKMKGSSLLQMEKSNSSPLWRLFLINMFRLDNPNFMCGNGDHISPGCFLCKSCSLNERIDRVHKVLSHGNTRELWHLIVRLASSDESKDMKAPTKDSKSWSYLVTGQMRPGSVRDLIAWYWKNKSNPKYFKAIKQMSKWGFSAKIVSGQMKLMKKGYATKLGVLSPHLEKSNKSAKPIGTTRKVLKLWNKSNKSNGIIRKKSKKARKKSKTKNKTKKQNTNNKKNTKKKGKKRTKKKKSTKKKSKKRTKKKSKKRTKKKSKKRTKKKSKKSTKKKSKKRTKKKKSTKKKRSHTKNNKKSASLIQVSDNHESINLSETLSGITSDKHMQASIIKGLKRLEKCVKKCKKAGKTNSHCTESCQQKAIAGKLNKVKRHSKRRKSKKTRKIKTGKKKKKKAKKLKDKLIKLKKASKKLKGVKKQKVKDKTRKLKKKVKSLTKKKKQNSKNAKVFNALNLKRYQLHALSPFELDYLKQNGYNANQKLPWKLKKSKISKGKKQIQSALKWSHAAIKRAKKAKKLPSKTTTLDITHGLGTKISRVISVAAFVGTFDDAYLKQYLILAAIANTIPYYDYSLNSVVKAINSGSKHAKLSTSNPTKIFDKLIKEVKPPTTLQVRLSWPPISKTSKKGIMPLVSYPPSQNRVSLRSTFAYFFKLLSENHVNWPTWNKKKRPLIMKKSWLKEMVSEAQLRVARDEYICLNPYFGDFVNRMMCKWPLRITKKLSTKVKKASPKIVSKLNKHLKTWESKVRNELKSMSQGLQSKYNNAISKMKNRMQKMSKSMKIMQAKVQHEKYLNHLEKQIHKTTYVTLSTMAHLLSKMDQIQKKKSNVQSKNKDTSKRSSTKRNLSKHKKMKKYFMKKTLNKIPAAVRINNNMNSKPFIKTISNNNDSTSESAQIVLKRLNGLVNDKSISSTKRTMAKLLFNKISAILKKRKSKTKGLQILKKLKNHDLGKRKFTRHPFFLEILESTNPKKFYEFHQALKTELNRMLQLLKLENQVDKEKIFTNKVIPIQKQKLRKFAMNQPSTQPKAKKQRLYHKLNNLHTATKQLQKKSVSKLKKLKSMMKTFKKNSAKKSKKHRKRKKKNNRTKKKDNRKRRGQKRSEIGKKHIAHKLSKVKGSVSNGFKKLANAISRRGGMPIVSNHQSIITENEANEILGRLKAELISRKKLEKASIDAIHHEQDNVRKAAESVDMNNKLLKQDEFAFNQQHKAFKLHEKAQDLADKLDNHKIQSKHRKIKKLAQYKKKIKKATIEATDAERKIRNMQPKERYYHHTLEDNMQNTHRLKEKMEDMHDQEVRVQRQLARLGEKDFEKRLENIIASSKSTKRDEAIKLLRTMHDSMMHSHTMDKKNEALNHLLTTLEQQKQSALDEIRAIHKQREALSSQKLTNNIRLLANTERKHSLAQRSLLAQAKLSDIDVRHKQHQANDASKQAHHNQKLAAHSVMKAFDHAKKYEHLVKHLNYARSIKPCCPKGSSKKHQHCSHSAPCICTKKSKPNGCIYDAVFG